MRVNRWGWPGNGDDMLARRTRLAQELPDRGAAIAPRAAALLGAELGWGATRQSREIEVYLEMAKREYSVADSTVPVNSALVADSAAT